MEKRPRSITIIGWLFVVFGSITLLSGVLPFGDISFAQRIAELKSHWYVHLSRILAIVAGAFMLKGRNWGRWLLVSAFNAPSVISTVSPGGSFSLTKVKCIANYKSSRFVRSGM